MLEKRSEELYVQFQNEIKRILAKEAEPFQVLSAVLNCTRTALNRLKDDVVKSPFKDQAQEICFFKHIKPKFYCVRIYYIEWYGLVTSIPVGDKETIRAFYLAELQDIQRFFRHISFHYRYYRMGATELDKFYFIRGAEIHNVSVAEMPNDDPAFATNLDFLISKIMAYELLQEYILKKIRELDFEPDQLQIQNPPELSKLNWTGDKTNLVEVIYGLFYTGQLNNGNASVADITKWMEQHLNINLRLTYRKFLDIRTRKRDSHTRFLDKMRDSIQQRVDEDNEYKPNRGIKLRNNRGGGVE